MPKPRVSIGQLLMLVVLVAVGFAALRNPSELGSGTTFTLTVGLLLFASVGAIARQGKAINDSPGWASASSGRATSSWRS